MHTDRLRWVKSDDRFWPMIGAVLRSLHFTRASNAATALRVPSPSVQSLDALKEDGLAFPHLLNFH